MTSTTLRDVPSLSGIVKDNGEDSTTMLSFYKFFTCENPNEIAEQARFNIKSLSNQIKGTLYVAEEGVNGQFMVPTNILIDFHSILGRLHNDLEDLDFNIGERLSSSAATSNPPFKKLLIKRRPKILTDGIDRWNENLNIDWSDAGAEIPPSRWHEEVEQDVSTGKAILIDCRNDYETEKGTFKGAQALNTRVFSDTWNKLDDMLAGVDKDRQRVLTFCTGGIRCVKVNAYLKHKGYRNIGRLEKGVIGYKHWLNNRNSNEIKGNVGRLDSTFEGENYVFDRRRSQKISMNESNDTESETKMS
jgi:UPF0176 protein